MYLIVRDKKNPFGPFVTYKIPSPTSATQFQISMLWEHKQHEDKQVLGGTLRPLHLVQEVLQQFKIAPELLKTSL